MIIAKCSMNSDKCGLFRYRDKLLAAVSEFQMIFLTDNDSNWRKPDNEGSQAISRTVKCAHLRTHRLMNIPSIW